ncbi:MAG: hypothetical protein M9892_03160 [Bacteroidetes bacterium]|nr:hypothetical protein [Bacteroidota bacterium]
MIRSYAWNLKNWLWRYLPSRRRREDVVALHYVFLAPQQQLADDLANRSADWDFRIKYSSQQGVLASLLNRLFDPVEKRIKVQTIADLAPEVVIYHDGEVDPLPQVLYHDGENEDYNSPILYHDSETDGFPDYRVVVPAALSGEEDRIRAWVARYNLADKIFVVEYE